MIIYKDVISGDELFSDSYAIKLIDDCYYEIDGKRITEKDGDYSSMIGANPSAEDAVEDVEANVKTDINIVIAHKLVQTYFDKTQFRTYIKDFMKKIILNVKTQEPDKLDALKKKMELKVKDILANFKSYEFYSGESMNPEGCVMLLDYREDGCTPFFTVFKDSVLSEKY